MAEKDWTAKLIELGAQVRFTELHTELWKLLERFPELRTRLTEELSDLGTNGTTNGHVKRRPVGGRRRKAPGKPNGRKKRATKTVVDKLAIPKTAAVLKASGSKMSTPEEVAKATGCTADAAAQRLVKMAKQGLANKVSGKGETAIYSLTAKGSRIALEANRAGAEAQPAVH